MTYREKLQLWVREALGALGGEARIIPVKEVWAKRGDDIKQQGDAFYTWQYDIRWAANQLRRKGALTLRTEGAYSVWVLKK